MRVRAEVIAAVLEVSSETGAGTTVRLRVPAHLSTQTREEVKEQS